MRKGSKVIGIDPGFSGALAFYDGKLQNAVDMPCHGEGTKRGIDCARLAELIREFDPQAVFLERVHAMPGQGVASMFRFGESFGAVRGVVGALQITIYLITPQKWKKALGLPKEKEAARRKATEMFPKQAAIFARKMDGGRAEAALLAWYGSRIV